MYIAQKERQKEFVYKTGKYGKIMPKITMENHFRVFLEDLFILIFKLYAKMKI